MSKKLLVVVVLAALSVVVGCNMISSKKLSADEQQISDLESRVEAAKSKIASASHAAGMTGMDATADADAAMSDLERTETEIVALRERTHDAAVKSRCERLMDESRSARGARD
ncbi:MAG TPA: hypothetical protein VE404_00570 [Verrucomicrobiae bacterium]|nr:hypothetical protein [Verrucomicrobiae bacterium]